VHKKIALLSCLGFQTIKYLSSAGSTVCSCTLPCRACL